MHVNIDPWLIMRLRSENQQIDLHIHGMFFAQLIGAVKQHCVVLFQTTLKSHFPKINQKSWLLTCICMTFDIEIQ